MPLMLPSKVWKSLKSKISMYSMVRIVIQTMLYPISLWAVRFAHKNHYPYIVIVHGANYVCLGNDFLSLMERRYEDYMLWRAKRNNSSFFCVSEAGSMWLKNAKISSKGVLYNSADYKAIDHICKDKPEYVRKECNIQKDTMVISFVGRLIVEKGIFQLVDACSQLISEGWNIKLLVVGDGPAMAELKMKNLDEMIYFGYCSHEETICILRESDCFCLPSDAEGMPTAVLEAILCNNYIIASPYGGAAEIIISNEYGCIMNGNSTDDVYQALKNFLNHQEECKIAANLCRKRLLTEGFTWETTCKNLISYFEKTGEN